MLLTKITITMKNTDVKNILIVDDLPENLQTIADFFGESKLPYRIFKAPDGEIALKILEKKHLDLVITDWEMPIMDGIELTHRVRNNPRTADIPVIMCTGVMTTSEHLEIALKAGAMDYIRTPVDKIELFARVRSALLLAESAFTINNYLNCMCQYIR
jgi:CheY-like chemotaxis protein